MQSFPTVVFDNPELDDMGQKELSARIEKVARELALLKNNPIASVEKSEWKSPVLYIAIIAAVIALAAWVEPRISTHLSGDTANQIKIEVGDQLKDPLKDLRGLAIDVAEIKGQLKELSPLLQQVRLKRLHETENLSPKQLSEQLPELKRLATTARTEKLSVKPETIEAVGKKLLEVGSAEAWDTALDFLNYKSFLNGTLRISVNNVQGKEELKTEYEFSGPTGQAPPQFGVAGAVPKEQAAQLLHIGEPDLNAPKPLGNDWIIGTGGSLTIDNMQMRRVILRNVNVYYRGGALNMKDVYFVNCTFFVSQQPNGRGLVTAALTTSPATTFTAS